MATRVWHKPPSPPVGFARELGFPPFQAHLLYNRGIRSRAEVGPYLAPDENLLNDPMLLPDMGRGVARLRKAMDSGESIGVFGDFDTDGVTGTALLTQALQGLGATVVPYIPDRVDEGHGLNDGAIRLLKESGVSLLVTVDCGSTSVSEVELASSLGMDTIVTDHHSLGPARTDALALINPRRPDSAYPYSDLTGVGLAFKLAEALYAETGESRPDHLLELAALGTVADVGPMTGENRYLVKRGLEHLNGTRNPGILALIDIAGLKLGSLDTESLSFGIIPRLNAPGRLDHAVRSFELLTATSMETAVPLAEELERQNQERRLLTEEGVVEARRQLEAQRDRGDGVPSMIVVGSAEWIPGILGLIAGRLSDEFYRPVVALSLGEEVSRGSARSIDEFNMVEALGQCQELLVRFGGHARAAGFTMATSSLPALRRRLETLAEEKLRGMDLTPRIEVDCEVSPALLNDDNLGFMESLSPFGEGNPAPVLLTRNARVVEARLVGGNGRHLKMTLSHSGGVWDAIAFRQGERIDAARDRVDIVYTAGLNKWAGRTRLQLKVLDLRRSL